ncbi:hypothetical protein Tcan_00509, partial [Toxocara canis]
MPSQMKVVKCLCYIALRKFRSFVHLLYIFQLASRGGALISRRYHWQMQGREGGIYGFAGEGKHSFTFKATTWSSLTGLAVADKSTYDRLNFLTAPGHPSQVLQLSDLFS